MPIYVKYGDIKGDVTADGHKGSDGWFEVGSFAWGVGRGISSPTGGAANRESSAPSVSEITLSKQMDVASYRLLDEVLQGEGLPCTIDFCKTDKGVLESYCKYILEDCMVSGYSVSSGGDRPTETISLNFTKVEYGFVGLNDKNEGVTTPKLIYDVGLAKVV